jgi:gluconokinase
MGRPASGARIAPATRIVIVMGVAGAGKTTVGRLLAERLGWLFLEGDRFHPPANVAKMRGGLGLTDIDRAPWLQALSAHIRRILDHDGRAVVACSALRRAYRDVLRQPGVRFVYLKGTAATFRRRLARRRGHFFDPALLPSQFAVLEEPRDAVVVDAARTPADVVDQIVGQLTLESAHA